MFERLLLCWLSKDIYCKHFLEINTLSNDVTMGLYHPLDGITNLKYKLLYFLTPDEKQIQTEKHKLLTGIDGAI
jgi:hypothetical protein